MSPECNCAQPMPVESPVMPGAYTCSQCGGPTHKELACGWCEDGICLPLEARIEPRRVRAGHPDREAAE
jgi:hypothetical protein